MSNKVWYGSIFCHLQRSVGLLSGACLSGGSRGYVSDRCFLREASDGLIFQRAAGLILGSIRFTNTLFFLESVESSNNPRLGLACGQPPSSAGFGHKSDSVCESGNVDSYPQTWPIISASGRVAAKGKSQLFCTVFSTTKLYHHVSSCFLGAIFGMFSSAGGNSLAQPSIGVDWKSTAR